MTVGLVLPVLTGKTLVRREGAGGDRETGSGGWPAGGFIEVSAFLVPCGVLPLHSHPLPLSGAGRGRELKVRIPLPGLETLTQEQAL